MSTYLKSVLFACLFVFFFNSGFAAQSLGPASIQDGVTAYDQGDFKTAFRVFNKAKKKNIPAQFYLGVMYEFGEGVKKDLKEAVICYRRAAEQGDAYAQYNLGLMYHDGKGVMRDLTQAFQWYLSSAKKGFKSAQFNVGVMYALGAGILQDFTKSHMWFDITLSSEPPGARREEVQKYLAIVSGNMTADQIEDAHHRVKAWRPNS